MKKRHRPLLSVAAILSVAALAACGPTEHSGAAADPTPAKASPTPRRSTPPSPASSPSASVSSSPKPARTTPSAAATSTRPVWPRVTFARLSFERPPGWTLVRYGTDACLEPVQRAGLPEMFGCAGLDIKSGYLPGNENRPYAAGQPGGWYSATDVQPCPVQPRLADGSLNGVSGTSTPPVASGLRAVGTHQAWYDRWNASCGNGYRFSPQAWYLPVSKLLFLDYTGHAETARVLRSVRFP
ncbi:hypothetical protein ACIF83_26155 [Streptomyces sp. NPDC085866]|uniref:hypothetical protein n=1 Tax=Streptomyces sp. NPDC085866 TaxID=3365736 RepID=UPI0037D62532